MMMDKFSQLTIKDETSNNDVERKALFSIIAGNEELWSLKDEIYNFQERCIKPGILESGICTSSKTLIKVGFNLFNSYPTDSLIDCFSGLDDKNYQLVMDAINIRFSKV